MRFFYVFFLTILACKNELPNSLSDDDTAVQKKLLSPEVATEDNRDSIEQVYFENIVEEYKKTYSESVSIDTIIKNGSDSMTIKFKYQCNYDSSLNLPEKYISMYRLDSFRTHSFNSSIVIYRNNSLVLKKRIDKHTFGHLLDESLLKYGVLLSPVFVADFRSVKICYSISIPLTDVGQSHCAAIDLKSGEFSVD